ncbi:peptidylprolyl isomerase [Enterococcus hirae]|nr:peptidylprolyl isomerase [Enterococcus hirae]
MKKIVLGVLLVSLFTLSACSSKKETAKSSAGSQASSQTASSAAKTDLEKIDLPQLDSGVAKTEDEVELVTSKGNITMKLFPKQAPKAVENFVKHAKDGYYNGVTFHRVIKEFMIQSGDPKGDGTGGESIWGKPFKNEISNQLYNIRGAVSMANSGGDNSNGSQFFIVQNDQDQSDGLLIDDYPQKIIDAYKKGGYPQLDGKYTVFGQVTSGMDVVDEIANVKVDSNDKPEEAISIEKINILQEAQN